jgi:hypothetical protein
MTDTPAPADDAPERTTEQRLAELAERLCRSYTYGVGLDELEKTDPEEASTHRDAAEHLMPWIEEAPKREIREAFGRGYNKGRDRGRATQARRTEKAQRAAVESVKALHHEWKRNETDPSPGYCAHCEKDGDLIRWPCPTMVALDQAQPATSEDGQ